MSMSPARFLFRFGEDRPPCLGDAVPCTVQIVDLNLEVDPAAKRQLKGTGCPRPPAVDLVEHQVRVTQDEVAESFLRPLIAEGKTDEVAPKTARCLVIGDGKFRDKPGLVAHGLTLAASDETVSGRCTDRQRRDALRISQSAPAKSAMKSRAPIRIATMLMATCA